MFNVLWWIKLAKLASVLASACLLHIRLRIIVHSFLLASLLQCRAIGTAHFIEGRIMRRLSRVTAVTLTKNEQGHVVDDACIYSYVRTRGDFSLPYIDEVYVKLDGRWRRRVSLRHNQCMKLNSFRRVKLRKRFFYIFNNKISARVPKLSLFSILLF